MKPVLKAAAIVCLVIAVAQPASGGGVGANLSLSETLDGMPIGPDFVVYDVEAFNVDPFTNGPPDVINPVIGFGGGRIDTLDLGSNPSLLAEAIGLGSEAYVDPARVEGLLTFFPDSDYNVGADDLQLLNNSVISANAMQLPEDTRRSMGAWLVSGVGAVPDRGTLLAFPDSWQSHPGASRFNSANQWGDYSAALVDGLALPPAQPAFLGQRLLGDPMGVDQPLHTLQNGAVLIMLDTNGPVGPPSPGGFGEAHLLFNLPGPTAINGVTLPGGETYNSQTFPNDSFNMGNTATGIRNDGVMPPELFTSVFDQGSWPGLDPIVPIAIHGTKLHALVPAPLLDASTTGLRVHTFASSTSSPSPGTVGTSADIPIGEMAIRDFPTLTFEDDTPLLSLDELSALSPAPEITVDEPVDDADSAVDDADNVGDEVPADNAVDDADNVGAGEDHDDTDGGSSNLLPTVMLALGLVLIGGGLRISLRHRKAEEPEDRLDGYLLIGGPNAGSVDGAYLPTNYDNDSAPELPLIRPGDEPDAPEPEAKAEPEEPKEKRPEGWDPGPTSVRKPTTTTSVPPAVLPPHEREHTSCDWELHYWTGSKWHVLREAPFPAHKCCTYKIKVGTKILRHEQAAGFRQDVGSERLYMPDYDFGWNALDYGAHTSTRSGPEGLRGWVNGLGDPLDQSHDAPESPYWQQAQGDERPEVAAHVDHEEKTRIVVHLEAGCPDAINTFDGQGHSTIKHLGTVECTNDDPAICPIELNAFGEAYVYAGGDVHWFVGHTDRTDIDELERLAGASGRDEDDDDDDFDDGPSALVSPIGGWDSHDHNQRERMTFSGSEHEHDHAVNNDRTWSTRIRSGSSLHAAQLVPEHVWGTTDRVSTFIEHEITTTFELDGEMDKGDCETTGCCTGNPGHVCRCAPSFKLVLNAGRTEIVVDGRTFAIDRPSRGGRDVPPAIPSPNRYQAWPLV